MSNLAAAAAVCAPFWLTLQKEPHWRASSLKSGPGPFWLAAQLCTVAAAQSWLAELSSMGYKTHRSQLWLQHAGPLQGACSATCPSRAAPGLPAPLEASGSNFRGGNPRGRCALFQAEWIPWVLLNSMYAG
jgi:hypothetical protein